MWGPGPWVGPMWGFWWIFPLIGLAICLFFVIAMVRMISSGGRFMCMGSRPHNSEDVARLRKEVEDLREELKKQAVTR
jgi:uncharacterized membrane protein